MRINRFLNVVPKAVQVWAMIIVSLGVIIGLVVGHWWAGPPTSGPAELWRSTLECGAAGLGLSAFLAVWLLCLGFIYADARRRMMRPVLWVVVAFLVPHLLGFLLYFVLRQPIASACTHCGKMVPVDQRFCSWCGTPQQLSPVGERRLVVE